MKTAFATLSQLKQNPDINPRFTDPGDDVEDVKAQIAHKGMIGQLWVRAVKGGKLEILDGGRRFIAIHQMARDGAWKKDAKIPVNIFTANDAEARDLALSANFPRKDLSPADEAIGFTRLTLSGLKVEDIAAHYAVSPRYVQQRIAIGSLPKAILAALRDDVIDIATAEKFTACAAERALKLFRELEKKGNLRAWSVANALADGSISGNDRRCLFVGAAAYEAAGGTISRDLFSDNETWNDEKLLDALFEQKIADTAQALKDEGWSFVEVMRKNTHQLHSWGKSVSKETRDLGKDEKAGLKKLKAELKALSGEYDSLEEKNIEDELSASEAERMEQLPDLIEAHEARIAALEQPVFTARQMAGAGVVITVDEHHSPVEIIRGLIKPGTKKAKAAANGQAGDGGDDETEAPAAAVPESASYSDALTAALAAEAQKASKLAMALSKPAMAYRLGLAARIMAATGRFHDIPFAVQHRFTDAGTEFARLRAEVLAPFGYVNEDDAAAEEPENISFAAIYAHLETLQPDEIGRIEAVLAADLFEVSSIRNADVQAVITMIDPDMAGEGWKPDADFMGRLNRAQLTAVISDCDPAFKTPATWKKAELVDEAAGRAMATGWLPPQLRTPTYKGPDSNAWAEHLAAKSAEEIVQQQAAE